jgi:hypothetical protein
VITVCGYACSRPASTRLPRASCICAHHPLNVAVLGGSIILDNCVTVLLPTVLPLHLLGRCACIYGICSSYLTFAHTHSITFTLPLYYAAAPCHRHASLERPLEPLTLVEKQADRSYPSSTTCARRCRRVGV